ncbi:MAG: DUF2236 domain-containing protein [Deltaproteobacteria bacterium]|nr:DUF2236 domain-containing protein [Deltaproteobacteria bacterium]
MTEHASQHPQEFRYWARVETPRVRALRALGRTVLGFDLAPPDDVVRAFAASYYDADPIAEAFVEDVYMKEGGRQRGRVMLDQALSAGVASVANAPASLVALFEDVERDPEWLDRDLVERGAKVFRRYGTDMFKFAGAITLQGYSESSVAKPLALTGGYAGSSARRRFLETAAFWIAVSEPGGLGRFAPGLASALRVRVMHVFVRKRLLAHPEWNVDRWGVPISQGDALLTLMGGSFIPGVALHAMGYRPSKEDIEAMMHFWRYVGHLMGVRPRFYPRSLREAAQLSFVTIMKGANTSGDDGRLLCQSYVNAFAPDPSAPLATRIRQALSHRAHVGTTRFFLSTRTYRKNRLPSAGLWALFPLLTFPYVFTAETLRRQFPSLDDVADRVARRSRNRWFARHMGARRAEYEPQPTMTR